MNVIFWTCRSRRVGSFQRKQLRKEKKAQCVGVEIMTWVSFLKTFLYCDRFLPWHLRYASTIWKNVFRSKVVARNLKALRPPPPYRLADPYINYSQTSSMCYYLLPSSTYPKPYNFNASFFCLGAEFNVGWVAFTYGVNSRTESSKYSISIQQKPEVHVWYFYKTKLVTCETFREYIVSPSFFSNCLLWKLMILES